MPDSRAVRIADIKIGKRHRANNGNLAPLKASIQSLGVLHPIGVNSRLELKYGGRRLAACIELGWEEVPVRVLESLDDAVQGLLAERDENVCREEMNPTDAYQLGQELKQFEKEAAANRQRRGKATDIPSGYLPEGQKGDTRDKVADALGMSGSTFEKIEEVVTEGVEGLVELMNSGEVSIDAAAKIAALSEAEQKKIVAGGKKAIANMVAKIRAEEKAKRAANKGKTGGKAPGPHSPPPPSEPVSQADAAPGDQTTPVQVPQETPVEEPAEDETTVMGKLTALLKQVKQLVKKNPLLAKDAAVAIHEIGEEVILYTPELKYGETRPLYESSYFRLKDGKYEGPHVQKLEGIGIKAIDTYGRMVPQELRDEFCEKRYQQVERHLQEAVMQLHAADVIYKALSARGPGVPWFNDEAWSKAVAKGAKLVSDGLSAWMFDSLPYSICLFCNGHKKDDKGIRCLKCKFTGYWPKNEVLNHPTMIKDMRPKVAAKQEAKA